MPSVCVAVCQRGKALLEYEEECLGKELSHPKESEWTSQWLQLPLESHGHGHSPSLSISPGPRSHPLAWHIFLQTDRVLTQAVLSLPRLFLIEK